MGGGGQKSIHDVASDSGSTKSKSTKTDTIKLENMATVTETLSFALEGEGNTKLIFILGIIGGIGNGLVRLSSI